MLCDQRWSCIERLGWDGEALPLCPRCHRLLMVEGVTEHVGWKFNVDNGCIVPR